MTWLEETTDSANPNGYLIGTAIFLSALVVMVIWQTLAKKFHPFLYWVTIVASTTAGTTMADFADRSLGIGYTGGSALLLACVIAVPGGLVLFRKGPFRSTRSTPARSKLLLLDHHYFFPDAGHGPRRLGCGHGRARLRRWRAGLRRRPGGNCAGLLLHQYLPRGVVLDGLHPDQATGRHGGRFLRQADFRWRLRTSAGRWHR